MKKIISKLKHTFGIFDGNGIQVKKCFIMYFMLVTIIYGIYLISTNDEKDPVIYEIITYPRLNKYLINTTTCKIPDLDPFNEDVLPFIKKEDYRSCRKLDLLTYVDKSDGLPVLRINNSLLSSYSHFTISCCYSNITRINFEVEVDDEVSYSHCIPFQESIRLFYSYVRVECSTVFGKVYVNTHASTLPIKNASQSSEKDTLSVLFVAIDSMSKSNLARTMPRVYQYLEKNYLTLDGYTKVGENTFPNLMAILTGNDLDTVDIVCNKTTKANYCNIIWDDFKKAGYTTAYGEDDGRITTFNYFRPGFLDPPTDYYYHPYMMASEGLSFQVFGMRYCAGPETSGERILNAATDFSVTHRNVSTFGLFWMNSFSHEDVNLPSAMENVLYNFLTNNEFMSSLNNTLFVFLSDHGYRYGGIRDTATGWFEERLPYIYLRVPDNFKHKHSELYKNMVQNQKRLTSPYDMHKTLEEILKFNNKSYVPRSSSGCKKCISLFQSIPENRTCTEAGIVSKYCTCYGTKYTSANTTFLKPIASFVVETVNDILSSHQHLCIEYELDEITSTRISEKYLNSNNETYQIVVITILTVPEDKFEATIEVMNWELNDFKLSGTISRLTRYAEKSACINDAILKKYCYCKNYCTLFWRIFGFC